TCARSAHRIAEAGQKQGARIAHLLVSGHVRSLRITARPILGGSCRSRDGGEQGIESLGHRRVRENGVAENRVGSPPSIAVWTAAITSPALPRPRGRSS